MDKDRIIFSLPLEKIKDLKYIQNKRIYGIGLILKQPLPPNSMPYFAQFQSYSCDIFLPYFSQTSFQELKDVLENI